MKIGTLACLLYDTASEISYPLDYCHPDGRPGGLDAAAPESPFNGGWQTFLDDRFIVKVIDLDNIILEELEFAGANLKKVELEISHDGKVWKKVTLPATISVNDLFRIPRRGKVYSFKEK